MGLGESYPVLGLQDHGGGGAGHWLRPAPHLGPQSDQRGFHIQVKPVTLCTLSVCPLNVIYLKLSNPPSVVQVHQPSTYFFWLLAIFFKFLMKYFKINLFKTSILLFTIFKLCRKYNKLYTIYITCV